MNLALLPPGGAITPPGFVSSLAEGASVHTLRLVETLLGSGASEMPCLGERRASSAISNCVSVAGRDVDRSAAARLRGEQAVRPNTHRLTGRKRKLVGDRRRSAAVTL